MTNGWRLAQDAPFADALLSHLDWLGLAVDSDETATNLKEGRSVGRRTIPTAELVRIADLARRSGLGLKVNTFVTRANAEQDFRSMISDLRPDRWKLFHALPVRGQNDVGYRELAISGREFWAFVNRHRELENASVVVVPEDLEALTGSNAMVDPGGYAFDNTQGG